MITSFTRALPLAALVLLALVLRTWHLADRPMHADEANQAVKTGLLLDSGRYTFDPTDHHGPSLYFLSLPVAWARGQVSLATLDEKTVRLVTALFGTGCVLLLAWLARPAGAALALLSAAFLALSPPAVYYARYYVHETLLMAFTLLAAVSAFRWWSTRALRWAVVAGVAVGAMLATKETALLLVICACIAVGVARLGTGGRRSTEPPPSTNPPDSGVGRGLRTPPSSGERRGGYLRAFFFAAAAALLTAALFYSSFGTSLQGLRDALLAPLLGAQRATGGSGHEKPWWYYLQLLSWQRHGFVWEQVGFTALAIVGAIASFRTHSTVLKASAVYTGLVLLALSAVAYKTPWNVIHVLPPMALLAAGGVLAIARSRAGRYTAATCAIVTLTFLLGQTKLIAFTRSADWRNPYAYVHSAPDVLKYRALALEARHVAPDQPIRVISQEYWPLPWYFRGIADVGYWAEPPADCDGALVVCSTDFAETVRARLRGTYRQSFLGLRPGVMCIVFTREVQP